MQDAGAHLLSAAPPHARAVGLAIAAASARAPRAPRHLAVGGARTSARARRRRRRAVDVVCKRSRRVVRASHPPSRLRTRGSKEDGRKSLGSLYVLLLRKRKLQLQRAAGFAHQQYSMTKTASVAARSRRARGQQRGREGRREPLPPHKHPHAGRAARACRALQATPPATPLAAWPAPRVLITRAAHAPAPAPGPALRLSRQATPPAAAALLRPPRVASVRCAAESSR